MPEPIQQKAPMSVAGSTIWELPWASSRLWVPFGRSINPYWKTDERHRPRHQSSKQNAGLFPLIIEWIETLRQPYLRLRDFRLQYQGLINSPRGGTTQHTKVRENLHWPILPSASANIMIDKKTSRSFLALQTKHL
jgi:hypothetical protein